MNPVPPLDSQDITPRIFRAVVLIAELIERHGVSLDYAASTVFTRMKLRPGEKGVTYRLAWSTLVGFAPAELILKEGGYKGLPARRRNAFRVAYVLMRRHGFSLEKISSVRGGLLGNRLLSLLRTRAVERVEEKISSLPSYLRLAYMYTIPPLVTETLVAELGSRRAEEVSRAYAWRRVWVRPLDVSSSSRLEEALDRLGMRYRRDRDLGFLYEVHVKPWEVLPRVPGAVYQDKASVLVAEILSRIVSDAPVIDAAAAPLLKTTLICARGIEVIAADVSERRMRRGLGLASQCRMLHILVADSTMPPLKTRFGGALLDAPCTNSGALGRDPGLRLSLWSLSMKDVAALSQLQAALLRSTFSLLKSRGILVYSTCSIFPGEGEEVVETIDAEPIPLDAPGECGYRGACRYRRLFPDRGTTGFFIAALAKP